mmetsp:Transcript_116397/g.282512  ORF Transcript_116397/g.282512 Transcript_116397/m.282512 type:complete len:215 (-) Transcript_116397:125-769(-)
MDKAFLRHHLHAADAALAHAYRHLHAAWGDAVHQRLFDLVRQLVPVVRHTDRRPLCDVPAAVRHQGQHQVRLSVFPHQGAPDRAAQDVCELDDLQPHAGAAVRPSGGPVRQRCLPRLRAPHERGCDLREHDQAHGVLPLFLRARHLPVHIPGFHLPRGGVLYCVTQRTEAPQQGDPGPSNAARTGADSEGEGRGPCPQVVLAVPAVGRDRMEGW